MILMYYSSNKYIHCALSMYACMYHARYKCMYTLINEWRSNNRALVRLGLETLLRMYVCMYVCMYTLMSGGPIGQWFD